MNLSNYTIKAQETIQAAQQLAFSNGNPNIETNHLLKVLLSDVDSPVAFLLKRVIQTCFLPNSTHTRNHRRLYLFHKHSK